MTPSTVAVIGVDAADGPATRGRQHPTTSRFVIALNDAFDEGQVGGKARSLARMLDLGLTVPQGMVLTCDALTDFLAANDLQAHIDGILAGHGTDLPTSSPASTLAGLTAASREIEAAILDAACPAVVESAIDVVAEHLLEHAPLVVRSSAVGEDGVTASFAGQFDSVLHVCTRDDVHAAVRRCWASFWSARALFYRARRGITPRGMALVIQQQVTPSQAGVLFTQSPAAGAPPGLMVIEHVDGLADRLVSGEATPHRTYVSRATGAVVSEEASDSSTPLERAVLLPLVDAAERLERAFQSAQDIEWAADAMGCVFVVQSRPITTPTVAPGSATPPVSPDAAATTMLWSNANVSENFPEPISPLLYSIAGAGYRHYFRNLGIAFGVSRRRLRAMDGALRTIVGTHAARLYYNLTHIHAVLRMAPFGERLAQAFNLFVGAGEIASSPADARRWTQAGRLRQSLELVRIALCVCWQFAWLPHRLRGFERTADAFAARTTLEQLRGQPLATLGLLLVDFLEIRCRRWKNASLCDTAAMVCYAALRHLLARSGFGDEMHTRLLRALPGVPSSQPPLRLWQLARLVREDVALQAMFARCSDDAVLAAIRTDPALATFRQQFERYLEDWGFRSSGELMLTVPTLQENPAPVIALIRSHLTHDAGSPAETMARQALARAADTRLVLRAIARRAPQRLFVTWLLLRWTQFAIVARERARLKQALLYTRLRGVALQIGDALVRDGRLRARDDVFMLTWQELEEICAGRSMFPTGLIALVQLRQRQHAEAAEQHPPDTIRLPASAAWSAARDHAVNGGTGSSNEADTPGGDPGQADMLSGSIACGGAVRARAAVLASVDESQRIGAGDILVTRQTDPGWAPVFSLVSGLVIERGGMLSHGAIIAREFGLPCLVNVRQATTRIPHGAALTLDANQGFCRLEPRP